MLGSFRHDVRFKEPEGRLRPYVAISDRLGYGLPTW